jgi:enolase
VSDPIASVFAWEALDSRGRPTVACAVRLRSGIEAEAIVPSGASTGRHEAHELRDGGERYDGRGVRQAVRNVVETLGPALTGRDPVDFERNDATLRELDGTPSLERLGANAVLAVSVAALRAAAASAGVQVHEFQPLAGEPCLPLPMVNVVSGGAHAGGLVDIQDVLVVPVGAASFAEAIEWAARVRAATAALAAERGLAVRLVADEGGLGPAISSTGEALELLAGGIARSGLRPGDDASIAIDVAATQLAVGPGRYALENQGSELDAGELVDVIDGWRRRYPIVSVEDPLADDDWSGWASATARLRDGLQVLGDDLLVTDPARLSRAIADGVANAVLVKPNQVGTLSQAATVVRDAQAAGYASVVSARSGDTEDSWLADLAVGWRAGQIKVGSTMRSERTAKWNRLLEIEALDPNAEYAGPDALASG